MGSIRNICLPAEMVKERKRLSCHVKTSQQENLQVVSSAVSLIRHYLDLLDPAIKIEVARPPSSMVFSDFIIIWLELLLTVIFEICYFQVSHGILFLSCDKG